MVNNPDDFTIGRIWNWVGISSKKPTVNLNTAKPDVILPFGRLYLDEKVSLVQVATKLNQVALLPNCDLIIGPDLVFGGVDDDKEKQRVGNENKEFRADIIFLKKAIEHGTVNIEALPKK